ncbi:MAG: hypothetical protein LAO09_12825 [Acidobacteriia bacterium]|nr:hypothetical protein [Terriglobia bacterium]
MSSSGYINGTPLTVHTSAAFNSSGSTTLVAFVSSHPTWNGSPVSISGLSDNVGNIWKVLTGPTQWPGASFTLLSAIYYVNVPVTSATHTVTVNMTNPAPLVFHVFAVSGSEITEPPLFSAITGPDPGGTSADVVSAPVTAPNNSLLLSWVKNESGATATALDGYSLDGQSTSFLWAESQTALSDGMYTGHFQYSEPIGWQTALVALKPLGGPVAFSQGVTTDQDTPVGITVTAFSPQGFPLTYTVLAGPINGTLSGTAPNLTYTPNTGYIGPDSFTFKANDGITDSNVATVRITVQGPAVVSSRGYINGTPSTTHTTAPFNSSSATALVAFVSTNTPWNSLPVSISGLNDSMGNTWNVLTGPTVWVGQSWTLLSSIYYVNSPATSATHTVTVNLTNPAPLVVHVFAVSGSDVTGPPIFSAITDPGVGGTSADVVTAPITAPANSLLLTWAKNETGATATALDGYTLDPESTSFLWAEFQTVLSDGSYTGHFQYDAPIGWQTAIVGFKPLATAAPPTPIITSMPADPTNQTSASFSFSDTKADVTFLCQLDGNGFSSCSSPTAYTGLNQGTHTFSVEAQDAGGNQSGAANFSWTIETTPPPAPVITSKPNNPTNQTSASFSFSDTELGVSFFCQLDGSGFGACSSPKTYTGLGQGSHTFSVKAQDTAGNQSNAASFTWTIDTTAPPKPVITSAPTNPTNQTSASFSFSDTEPGVSFQCQLDGSGFSTCSSPTSYLGLAEGKHTFSVRAQDAAGNRSGPASFTWTVDTTPPPQPVITSKPANPTKQTSASFGFSDTEKKVGFLCQLDGSGYSVCSSPKKYTGLAVGDHTFAVKAQDAAGNQSSTASYTWTITN